MWIRITWAVLTFLMIINPPHGAAALFAADRPMQAWRRDLQAMKLLTQQEGWASTNSHLFWTSDGVLTGRRLRLRILFL
jgi:hypothetical protein